MSLNRNDVLKLYLTKRSKGVRNKDVANVLEVSESAISQYFAFKKSMSDEKVQQMIDYIHSIPSKSDFE